MKLSHNTVVTAITVALVCGGAWASDLTLLVDPMFGSTENTGASASVSLSFLDRGKSDVLAITIENTTPPEIGAALTAIGLELPEAFDFYLKFAPGGSGNYFDTLLYNERFSPGWLNAPDGYDIVISGDDSFLGQGPRGAPMAGESETISLYLGDTGLSASDLARSAIDFYMTDRDNFLVGRFQRVGRNGEDSDKVRGGVPEPATGLLLLAGSWALFGRRRTRLLRP